MILLCHCQLTQVYIHICSVQHKYCMIFSDYGVPTSVDFVRSNPCQLVVSYQSSHAVLFDTETGKAVLELKSTLTSGVCVCVCMCVCACVCMHSAVCMCLCVHLHSVFTCVRACVYSVVCSVFTCVYVCACLQC